MDSLPPSSEPQGSAAPQAPREYTLPPAVTIETVESVYEQLKPLAEAGGKLSLNADTLDVITTPGVQLLLALSQTLEQGGGSLAVHGAKEGFFQAFATLGVTSQLKRWEENAHG